MADGVILCCGEALIDLVPHKDASGADVFLPIPGGSPFNTAVALGRLGVDVGFFGGISTDYFGDILISHLEKNNVDTSHIPRSRAPTSLALVTPETEDSEVNYQFYMNETASTSVRAEELPHPLPSSVEVLLFGSTSLATEPTASTLIRFMHKETGKRVITLDPNIRPSLIPDPDAFRRRFLTLLSCADIVKMSLTDLAWLSPSQDWREFAQLCLSHGVSVLFLTNGKNGAWGITSTLEIFIESETLDVSDSIGAGDSFHAGVLAQLSQSGKLSSASLAALIESDLKDCLTFGAQAAAITCSRPGADPPWRDEL